MTEPLDYNSLEWLDWEADRANEEYTHSGFVTTSIDKYLAMIKELREARETLELFDQTIKNQGETIIQLQERLWKLEPKEGVKE